MASIERTAYPRLRNRLSDDERNARYTLSGEERDFVRANARGAEQRLTLALMLKTFRHLGYFPDLSEIPEAIRDFVGRQLDLPPGTPTLDGPQRKLTLFRYRQSVLGLLGWTVYGEGPAQQLRVMLETTAQTMSDPADLINVAVEHLVKSHIELPAFSTLDRLVGTVRTRVHETLYTQVTATLTPAQEGILESLLVVAPGQSTTPFTRLKQTPGPATLKRIAHWIKHLAELDAILDPRPFLAGVAHTKVRQFAAEASALSISDIRDVRNRKRRHTLLLSLLEQAQSIARDELVEMFLRRIRRTRNAAQEQLQRLQERHRSIAESLLSVFGNLLRQARKTETDVDLGRRVRAVLKESGGVEALESEYTAISAYHENNYLPLLWPAHASSRSVLFQLLELLELRSASQDNSLLEALDVVIRHRYARRHRVSPVIDLRFASHRWQDFVLVRDQGEHAMDRHALEICVFLHLAHALRSGDLYVVGSQSYADYRTQLLPWETCRLGLADYCKQLDLPQTGAEHTARLRAELTDAARDVDAGFPDNSQLSIDPDGVPHLKRQKATALPEGLDAFEAMVRERMPERHLLDILKHAHHWAGYTRHFGPPSGSDPKLADATKRYLFTVFGYGCNLGASQTAQHTADVNRFAIRRINAQHITTPKLEAAMNDVIAEYVRFELPDLWGNRRVAIADGTHVELRENNLLGERHIRYGKYGGINYQHISGTYIALFTKFISCGVWEAVYILDALLEQRSELQPDTLHADTHGQSEPVFGLAHLLGIDLFPRMRTWNDAVFYRPAKAERYRHIDALFSDVIDWDLIERHWQDMMQVALSIQAGKILPSMLLRKLGSHNRKNKLYRAFRELGRVVRTLFLLRYISEAELRRTIRAETTKIESFNDFLDWISFGGPVIKSGDPIEQTKRLKYMNLVANAVMLQNVVDLTEALNSAEAEGYPVTKELVGRLSPYMRKHIRRFGQYVLDMDEVPEPLGPEALRLGL